MSSHTKSQGASQTDGNNHSPIFREPRGVGRGEVEIKKSRFLGTARKVSSPSEVKEWVARERESNPSARHVAHAFLIGPPNSETAGMHDDGEPKGTAGRPILDAIRASGIRNVLVTVTRYFGGTKLGTGGLARAYGECARKALENTPSAEVREEIAYILRFPYEYYERLVRVLESCGCDKSEGEFEETVSLLVSLPKEGATDCLEKVRDLTRGRCEILPAGESRQQ